MKRKKFLALALAGVMTAVTLTACAPLDVLYDWFFGGGSNNASHGSEKSLVTESVELENKLKAYLGLSETTASDRAKQTLEAVAEGFDPEWLKPNNELNEKAKTALESITKEKLAENEQLWVDVMKWPSPGVTADTIPNRRMYWDKYQYLPPDLGGSYHDCVLMYYGELKRLLKFHNINDAELYVGTFEKDGNKYAAMVIIWKY